MKKKMKLFFYFFWFFCIFFLFYKIQEDINKYDIIFRFSFKEFFVLLFFTLILSITSYRFFYFFKKLTKYSSSYNNWCSLFFQTILMNLFFSGSGHLFRAIELKKKNINYLHFIFINYIFFFLILIINFNFFLFSFYFITEKKIILLIFLIFSVITLITINKKFYTFLFMFFNKKLKFIKNIYKDTVTKILIYLNDFLSKKNILIFLFFSLLIFFLEFLIINLLISNFFLIKDIYYIWLIFIVVFYLNKIPFLMNVIGLNEIIVGLFVENLGFNFLYGSLIQITYRIFFCASAILCSIFYYLISLKKSS
jgi:hypothetical protein